MELNDWADQIALDLDSYGAFGRLEKDANWQDWAMQFLNNANETVKSAKFKKLIETALPTLSGVPAK
jgi:hypothetical protein